MDEMIRCLLHTDQGSGAGHGAVGDAQLAVGRG